MFFGLSLRQLICAVLATIIGIGVYFGLRDTLGLETTSWLCIVGALPPVLIGFVKYHGMSAERFVWAWVKSELLYPRRLIFRARNTYYNAIFGGRGEC